MNSDTKGGLAGFYIVATIFLSIWFGFSLKDGLDRYIQFPKNHQITQCLVNSTDVIKWSYSKFQVIWTVNYNDTQSEKISKIFLTNYTTYTDAIEATNNQYQIGQVYTCFFNKNKPYDLLWTVDDTVTSAMVLYTAYTAGLSYEVGADFFEIGIYTISFIILLIPFISIVLLTEFRIKIRKIILMFRRNRNVIGPQVIATNRTRDC